MYSLKTIHFIVYKIIKNKLVKKVVFYRLYTLNFNV